MSITIFVLLYCAARLLFIKNFDRFFILQSFTPKEISSRTVLSVHLAIAACFLFFVEDRRWRGALPRKNYISALSYINYVLCILGWKTCGDDYPGHQRFFFRGFRCRSCLYYDLLRRSCRPPSTAEAKRSVSVRRAREKTSAIQGRR